MGSILFGQFLYWYGFWKIVLYWATWVGELRLHVVFVLSQTLCLGINFLLIWNCQFEHVYIILLFAIGTEHVFWTSHLHVLQLEDGSSCSGGHRWLTLGSKTLSLPNTKNSSASDWLTRSGLVGMVYPLRLQNEALHEIWYRVYSSLFKPYLTGSHDACLPQQTLCLNSTTAAHPSACPARAGFPKCRGSPSSARPHWYVQPLSHPSICLPCHGGAADGGHCGGHRDL